MTLSHPSSIHRTHSCDALPDTGATRSVVTSSLVEKYGLQNHVRRLPPNVQLKAANNSLIPLRGHISLCVTANGHSSVVNALVSEDLSEVFFISWHDLVALRVLPPDFPNAIVQQLVSPSASSAIEKLKVDFEDILGDKLDISVGKGCPPMTIHLTDQMVRPLHVNVARQVPVHMRDMASKSINDLLSAKRITRVTEPTDWCSPANFVMKPCGTKVRLVTDY